MCVRGKFYKKKSKLGKGGYGQVSLVQDVEDGAFYALKQVRILNRVHATAIAREVKTLLASVYHNHVIKLFSCSVSESPGHPAVVNFIMEYCPGGNLSDRLRVSSTQQQELNWMLQLSDAVSFLHAKGIVHRDLKPENILLSSEQNLKVADFGLARSFASKTELGKRNRGALRQNLMYSIVGTPHYMAPEVHSGALYTEKADVFSLGSILYAIKERRFITIVSHLSTHKQRIYGAFVALYHQDGRPLGFLSMGEALQRNPECKLPFRRDAGFVDCRIRETICAMLNHHSHSRPDAQLVHGYLERTLHRIQHAETIPATLRLKLPKIPDFIKCIRSVPD